MNSQHLDYAKQLSEFLLSEKAEMIDKLQVQKMIERLVGLLTSEQQRILLLRYKICEDYTRLVCGGNSEKHAKSVTLRKHRVNAVNARWACEPCKRWI